MNCKIPFTKDIELNQKIFEITSISLEHEIKVEDGTLKGNFIVSGDFKSHEVSVNKEAFSYVLPFLIDLQEDIDTNTIEFMIDDFTYDVIDSSILRVNIDFNVIASKKEVPEEVEEESIFKDATNLFLEDENQQDNRVLEEKVEEAEDILKTEDTEPLVNDSIKVEEVDEAREVEVEQVVTEKKLEKESEDTIINSLNGVGDEYTTYHIHMVSDGESVETICTMYNSNMGILSDYNDLNNLAAGDKLIIPDKNE